MISSDHSPPGSPLDHSLPLGRVRKRIPLLNVFVHDVAMEDVVSGFSEGLMLTLHVDMIMKLQYDREFFNIFETFDLVTCDSQILYFATRFLGTPVRERVSGSDYFPRFYMHHRSNSDITVFLCGGKPGVAEIAAERINAKVGRKMVVGTLSPAFDFDGDSAAEEAIIDAVNSSGATVLLVGLGGGRQEKFIVRNRHRFEHVRLFLPLGGTIDYEAGTFRRPPSWVTDWGMEWLYRLVREPRQRWHRYVVHEPPVLALLLKQKLGRYRNPFGVPPDCG